MVLRINTLIWHLMSVQHHKLKTNKPCYGAMKTFGQKFRANQPSMFFNGCPAPRFNCSRSPNGISSRFRTTLHYNTLKS